MIAAHSVWEIDFNLEQDKKLFHYRTDGLNVINQWF